jgi:mono/diheme cytochrome c family protein
MLRSALVLVIGTSLVSACGGPAGETREPGEVAAQYQGPIESTDVARGEELYNSLCMSCHGGGAPALEGLGWEPGLMRQQIREGGGRMPAIRESRLSAPDLEAILAFMTTNGGVAGDVGGDATEGGEAPVEGDETLDEGAATEGEDAL